MTTIPRTPREAVRLGAAFLDDAGLDGWRSRINVYDLDISDGTLCILGQLYGGSYYDGTKALGLQWVPGADEHQNFRTRYLGFASGLFDAWQLDEAWREYLKEPAPVFVGTGERTYTETQVSEMLTSIAKELERALEAGTAVPLTSWGIVATAFYDLKKG